MGEGAEPALHSIRSCLDFLLPASTRQHQWGRPATRCSACWHGHGVPGKSRVWEQVRTSRKVPIQPPPCCKHWQEHSCDAQGAGWPQPELLSASQLHVLGYGVKGLRLQPPSQPCSASSLLGGIMGSLQSPSPPTKTLTRSPRSRVCCPQLTQQLTLGGQGEGQARRVPPVPRTGHVPMSGHG